MILFIAYVLNVIDYFFTKHWVSLYGYNVEGNPISLWLFNNGLAGVVKIIGMGILFSILAACIRKSPKSAWVAYLLLVVYALILIYHVIIFLYTRGIL